MEEKVILVDKNDNQIGVEDKMKAHRNGGKLHRAFSVFILNSKGEVLIQKRAESKYHSPGLWANACCSHPRIGESLESAVHRRLKEEMGLDCKLKEFFTLTYRLELDNDLWEWEFDHIFIGKFNGNANPSSEEVAEWKWVDLNKLEKDIGENFDKYASWFKIILKDLIIKLS